MKKVYVLVAATAAAFGALSVGSASFASSPCPSCGPGDSVSDTVPDTVPTTTAAPTTAAPTTAAPTSIETTTTADSGSGGPTSIDSTTTTADVGSGGVVPSTDEVGSGAPTTTARRAGDGLLPNTGNGIAMPLILAGLAAGTGAATLMVRRRPNAS